VPVFLLADSFHYRQLSDGDRTMSKDKIYFKNLDSIRFIAALMVYLAHAVSPSYAYLPIKNTIWEKLLYTFSNGELGVSIFFVLSGFLITYLLISEYELNGHVKLRNFYIRRVLRIWPLFFFVVVFSFFVYPFAKSIIGMDSPHAANIWYHVTFLSNFDIINVNKFFNGNAAMSQSINWSVSIEEQFYVFWPLIFVFLPRKLWAFAISFVIIGSITFRILNHTDKLVLYFHTFSVLLDLGIGGLLAYFVKSFGRVKSFFEQTSTWTHLVYFLISASLIFWSNSLFDFEYGHAVGRIFISISFALIICSQAITKTESKLNLGRWSFANRWGKYTYGIYLLHPIAITLLNASFEILHISKENFLMSFSFGVAGFIITLLISWISYHYYESQFLKLKEKFATIKTH
jgi:peptidoglycan/LPS O-acetylase OafA/YrhL